MTQANTSQQGRELDANSPTAKASRNDFSVYFSLENNPFIDIVSARYHSTDFKQTRINYICGRLWLMCWFFAVSVPLFSFFDFAILPKPQALNILYARFVLSASLLCGIYLLRQQPSLTTIKGVMLIAFLMPILFYLYTMQNLSGLAQPNIPMVYAMMPYLTLAMLGLFPLTILGGLALLLVMFIPFISFEIAQFDSSIWPLINSVWMFCLFAGISLWLQASQLSMLMKLYRESTVDPLTKLINRRVLMRMAEKEQSQSRKSGMPFSIIMFDLDKFKRINDNYGHHVGDEVLIMTANVMKSVLNKKNIAARFGGEEFVVVLPSTLLDEAIHIAEQIRNQLKSQSVALATGELLHVSASLGVAQHKPEESVEQLFNRVDELLYAAKGGGRDLVVSELS